MIGLSLRPVVNPLRWDGDTILWFKLCLGTEIVCGPEIPETGGGQPGRQDVQIIRIVVHQNDAVVHGRGVSAGVRGGWRWGGGAVFFAGKDSRFWGESGPRKGARWQKERTTVGELEG